ncbi:MAG: hypothetical protein CVV44_20355 [Spirochaetae bacterium HGW-Spirochaetae-1]|jgi:hypothetical protein|nr:MAG: hypothetical protein CVV44_20355 [Spirochaetae bacterium HGW-Spirochaetae-1]
MSDVIDLVKAIKTQLAAAPGLAYVKHFDTSENENDLVKKGKFPWVNVKITNRRTTIAGSLSRRTHKRIICNVIITFSVRDVSFKNAMEGGTDIKGIWDLQNDIDTALDADLSFGDLVNKSPYDPDTATDAVSIDSGRFWIGRGATKFNVFSDVNI